MVAMGRALMSRPKLLLMDEPSMGLAPILVERNFEIIKQVHESGVAILVVEQNANVSLSIADRGYVLSTGRLVLEGKAAELRENEELGRPTLAVDTSVAACRSRFPIFEQLVYVNSCSQGALSDCRASGVRRLPDGLGRARGAVGLLGRAHRSGADVVGGPHQRRSRTTSR